MIRALCIASALLWLPSWAWSAPGKRTPAKRATPGLPMRVQQSLRALEKPTAKPLVLIHLLAPHLNYPQVQAVFKRWMETSDPALARATQKALKGSKSFGLELAQQVLLASGSAPARYRAAAVLAQGGAPGIQRLCKAFGAKNAAKSQPMIVWALSLRSPSCLVNTHMVAMLQSKSLSIRAVALGLLYRYPIAIPKVRAFLLAHFLAPKKKKLPKHLLASQVDAKKILPSSRTSAKLFTPSLGPSYGGRKRDIEKFASAFAALPSASIHRLFWEIYLRLPSSQRKTWVGQLLAHHAAPNAATLRRALGGKTPKAQQAALQLMVQSKHKAFCADFAKNIRGSKHLSSSLKGLSRCPKVPFGLWKAGFGQRSAAIRVQVLQLLDGKGAQLSRAKLLSALWLKALRDASAKVRVAALSSKFFGLRVSPRHRSKELRRLFPKAGAKEQEKLISHGTLADLAWFLSQPTCRVGKCKEWVARALVAKDDGNNRRRWSLLQKMLAPSFGNFKVKQRLFLVLQRLLPVRLPGCVQSSARIFRGTGAHPQWRTKHRRCLEKHRLQHLAPWLASIAPAKARQYPIAIKQAWVESIAWTDLYARTKRQFAGLLRPKARPKARTAKELLRKLRKQLPALRHSRRRGKPPKRKLQKPRTKRAKSPPKSRPRAKEQMASKLRRRELRRRLKILEQLMQLNPERWVKTYPAQLLGLMKQRNSPLARSRVHKGRVWKQLRFALHGLLDLGRRYGVQTPASRVYLQMLCSPPWNKALKADKIWALARQNPRWLRGHWPRLAKLWWSAPFASPTHAHLSQLLGTP